MSELEFGEVGTTSYVFNLNTFLYSFFFFFFFFFYFFFFFFFIVINYFLLL